MGKPLPSREPSHIPPGEKENHRLKITSTIGRGNVEKHGNNTKTHPKNQLTPWKISMEPENHPFAKSSEPNLHEIVFHVNFQGVYTPCFQRCHPHYQVIQFVTFVSPNVGAHHSQPLISGYVNCKLTIPNRSGSCRIATC